jgi:hypothetical protein
MKKLRRVCVKPINRGSGRFRPGLVEFQLSTLRVPRPIYRGVACSQPPATAASESSLDPSVATYKDVLKCEANH